MEVFEEISDFCAWGFPSTQEQIFSVSSSKRKNAEVRGSEDEKETEEENIHLNISDEDAGNLDNHPSSPVDRFFTQCFKGEVEFGPICEESPLPSLPMTSVALAVNPLINLKGTKLMRRISWTDQQVIELRTEAGNWKEQFKGLQPEKYVLTEEKRDLEQQLKIITAKLAVLKASSNQAEKGKERLESFFVEQHFKATEEIRSLKELLNQKEAYAGDLVQMLTQTQEDLRASTDKIQFLESSLAPLKTSYKASEAEKEELKTEIEQWEKDYEALEDQLTLGVSWAFLNTLFETLTEARQEGFDHNAEIAKAKNY
ncbi:uncharacterized protein [Nicotiana tomentosiformis]|uniref:uncharacterized protein n=1 Tax=Nicotiana tomentosiformis TaxID=4098 RepID=UPI00388C7CB6